MWSIATFLWPLVYICTGCIHYGNLRPAREISVPLVMSQQFQTYSGTVFPSPLPFLPSLTFHGLYL